MDPSSAVTMIVMALATGAVAGAAEVAIKDGYEGLKRLLKSRFSLASVEPLEQKPDSKAKQESVAEDVAAAGADRDEEVLRAAQELIRLIESRAPEAAEAAGITIAQLRAGSSINIKDLVAEGSINITGLRAGNTGQPPLGNATSEGGGDPNA